MFDKFFKKAKGFMKGFADQFSDEKVSVRCPSCGGSAEGTINDEKLYCPYCEANIKNPHYTFAKSSAFDEDEQEDDGWGEDKDYWNEMEEDNLPPLPTNSNSVYAWIEKIGSTYSGDIPGIPFARVSLCDSYNECLESLQESFDEEKEKPFYEKPIQDLEGVRKQHPKATFIELF